MKKLILLTHGFPYGRGESFLENEIDYLSNAFNKIEILAYSKKQGDRRELPSNCNVHHYKPVANLKENIGSIPFLILHFFSFLSLLISEIRFVKKNKSLKISRTVIGKAVHDLVKGFQLYLYMKRTFTYDKNTVLYAYWFVNIALAAGLIKKHYPQVKAVARGHRSDIYDYEHDPNYLSFQYFKVKMLDKLVFISQDGCDYVRQKTNLKPEKFIVSKLGINLPPRIEKPVNLTEYHIVSCSFIHRVKRVHLIIDALSRIEDLRIRWTHLGGGPLQEEIEEFANRKLGAKKNIIYRLEGNQSNREVLEFYKKEKIDIFINVSSSEGIPVSIMEAMSYGIPVIATNVGGSGEIVNSSNGILLEKDFNIGFLTQGIIRLLKSDQEVRIRLSEAVYNTVAEKYNANINYPEFVQMLLNL
ncbi:MAG TPA: glycosyltransferase [Sunxiuqinia sp.]|nr:glycosyltransferase [Sunxiuqinia sp.]